MNRREAAALAGADAGAPVAAAAALARAGLARGAVTQGGSAADRLRRSRPLPADPAGGPQ